MKQWVHALAAITLSAAGFTAAADTNPTTWSGTDELHRTLPLWGDEGVRPYDEGVQVGMFYYLWHFTEPSMQTVYDVSEILENDSINPQWGPDRQYHWGSRPWLGYYRGGEHDVVGRHLQMLCDAGVDFLVFDCTNGPTYPDKIMALIEGIRHRQEQGARSPKLLCMVHARQNPAIEGLWNHLYSRADLADVWYRVDGKPLLLCDLEGEPFNDRVADITRNFTLRHSWAWAGGKENTWSWLDHYPQQTGYRMEQGRRVPEAISIAPAQHATTHIGKSYHNGQEPPLDARGLSEFTPQGLYFAEQWERALSLSPGERVPVLMITQWNEHIAMRFITDDPAGADPGKVRPSGNPADPKESYFVDVYNAEFNRDLEPSSHPLVRDNYYMQLVDGIRRYRGVAPGAAPRFHRTIDINGPWSQWDAEPLAFTDDRADHLFTATSQGSLNPTPGNDIVSAKAAIDTRNLYMMVQTADTMALTTPRSMRLLIDADANPATGWYGFDCMAQYDPEICAYRLFNLSDDNPPAKGGEVAGEPLKMRQEGRQLMLSIPHSLTGCQPGRDIDFKWLDSCPIEQGEPMLMYSDGDAAPNHRFNYRFRASAL